LVVADLDASARLDVDHFDEDAGQAAAIAVLATTREKERQEH
jgi:hypothetical protein